MKLPPHVMTFTYEMDPSQNSASFYIKIQRQADQSIFWITLQDKDIHCYVALTHDDVRAMHHVLSEALSDYDIAGRSIK